MMVFLVRFEVVRELENPLAEDRYLNFWRAAVILVLPVLSNNLCFQISRQCHSRSGTPRLFLILFMYPFSIAQARAAALTRLERERPYGHWRLGHATLNA
jgi:hypothetical protein